MGFSTQAEYLRAQGYYTCSLIRLWAMGRREDHLEVCQLVYFNGHKHKVLWTHRSLLGIRLTPIRWDGDIIETVKWAVSKSKEDTLIAEVFWIIALISGIYITCIKPLLPSWFHKKKSRDNGSSPSL